MLLPRLTGRRISLKKIRRIMKSYGLECGIRKVNRSREGRNTYEKDAVKPNILRRRFRLYRPNRVRVTDVTYLDYGDKKRAYGSALMDPVTGRLVAFVVSGNNNLEMAIETLRVSDSHPCEDGGLFHADQGTLYKSAAFQKEILERGLQQSMSKKGNCWDNATQESFFGHFKDECEYASSADIEELRKRVEEYSWYYNNERGMWDKGRMTPEEYEEYLLGLSEEQFEEYLAAEEKKYNDMKERAAELAKKRYGTLGV
jgi:transposase InsO family protein